MVPIFRANRNPGNEGGYDKNGASMTAELLNPERETKAGAADVKVTVGKIQLVDPDTTGGKAKNGQGHLVHRVDDGPSVVTTATKLGFHDLPHGRRRHTARSAPGAPHDGSVVPRYYARTPNVFSVCSRLIRRSSSSDRVIFVRSSYASSTSR